jgi:hypothetical protein
MATRDPPESLQHRAQHALTSLPYLLLEKTLRHIPPSIPRASKFTRSWLRSQSKGPFKFYALARDRHEQLMPPQSRSRGSNNPIFVLPRELRDQIYEYAWQGTHIYYQDSFCAVNARYLDCDGLCEEMQALPAWVTMHPQVQEEALHWFYRTAEFSVGDGLEFMNPFHESGLHGAGILSIEEARNVTVFNICGLYRPNGNTVTAETSLSPVTIRLNDAQYKLIQLVADKDTVCFLRLSMRLRLDNTSISTEDRAHLRALEVLQEASYSISHVQIHFILSWEPCQSIRLGEVDDGIRYFKDSCWNLARSILVSPSTHLTPIDAKYAQSKSSAMRQNPGFLDTLLLQHWRDNHLAVEYPSQMTMVTAMAHQSSRSGGTSGIISAYFPIVC